MSVGNGDEGSEARLARVDERTSTMLDLMAEIKKSNDHQWRAIRELQERTGKIDDHPERLAALEASQHRQRGAVALLGLMFSGGAITFIVAAIKGLFGAKTGGS